MKAVLYLNDQGLTAYAISCRILNTPRFCSWSDVPAIEEWLAELPGRFQCSLILDLVDEDIAMEPAPKLYLWEKAAIKNRLVERLKSEGGELIFSAWTGLAQTSAEGRSEELIQSASIIMPSHVSHFLNMLEEAEITVNGIYSAPFLLADFLKQYFKTSFNLSKQEFNSPFFVISRQGENSYRQTFFNQGRLRISRLIEIDKEEGDYSGAQTSLIYEAKLARNYIYNQNLVAHTQNIGYVFLDSEPLRLEGLQQRCFDEGLFTSDDQLTTAIFKAMPVGSFKFAKTFCGEAESSHFLADLLVGFVLNDRPAKFYFTEYSQKIYRIATANKALKGINIAALIALLGYGTIAGIDTYMRQYNIELLGQQIENHITEKERLQKLVDLQIDAKEIKASVDFSEAILSLKTDRTVGFKIMPISEVFRRHEHVQLINAEWKQLGRFDSHVYDVELEGLVFPFEEYYKQPVDWVDALVSDLKQLPLISQVDLVQQPLNRNLQQALTVSIKGEKVTALPFKLKMRVKDGQSK